MTVLKLKRWKEGTPRDHAGTVKTMGLCASAVAETANGAGMNLICYGEKISENGEADTFRVSTQTKEVTEMFAMAMSAASSEGDFERFLQNYYDATGDEKVRRCIELLKADQ